MADHTPLPAGRDDSYAERSRHGEIPRLFRSWDDSEEGGPPIDWTRIWVGIKRRLVLILLVGCMGVGAALGFMYFLQQRFSAEVFLLYQDESPKKLAGNYTINRLSLPTILEMMKMPVHYKATKSILSLNMKLDDLMDMVRIDTPMGKSNLIRIVSTGDDATQVQNIANTLASVLVKHSEDLTRRQLQMAYDYFNTQLQLAEQKLSVHDKALATFKGKHPHFELASGSSNLIDRASDARSNYQKALLAYNSLLVEYENLKREAARIPDHTLRYAYEESPLKDRIAQVEMALLQARTRYAEDNPKIKVLESQLSELRKMMTDASLDESAGKVYEKNPLKEKLNIELMRLQGRLRSTQKNKEDLEQVVARVEEEMEGLPLEQMEFAKLMHLKKSTEEETQQLQSTLRGTQLLLSLGDGDIELYQSSDAPMKLTDRFDDYVKFFPIVGFLMGSFFGVLLAGVLETSDRRLKTSRQVSNNYSVPCLQVIPEISKLHKRDSESDTLFYIRGINDRLETANRRQGLKTVCVCSSLDGEGKSTLAYHLACYQQKRLGRKTLLLELDHRPNPFIDATGVTKKPLNKALAGRIEWSETVHHVGGIDRAKAEYDPAMKELLKGEVMHRLWAQLQDEYEVIIVDAACITEDDFVPDMAQFCENTVFVVDSTATGRRYIDSALTELQNAGVAPSGMVLNKVMSMYVQDVRIMVERKRMRRRRWKGLFGMGKKKTIHKPVHEASGPKARSE